MTSTVLPLENYLKRLAEQSPAKFPVQDANYWSRYSALVDFLRSRIYPHVNAGLACFSKSSELYTDHGEKHFDEVVRYAGLLLGDQEKGLEPYDIYLLLSAIRLHDAGNIDGREEHEKRAAAVLKEAGSAVCPDTDEARLISEIAEAHGGTKNGSKDTISPLSEVIGMGPISCHPRMVAALVRIADEICEYYPRASIHHLEAGTLPPAGWLYHLYASAVKEARIDSRSNTFILRLSFDAKDLMAPYPTSQHTPETPHGKYLIDTALDRIVKLDTERIYCNRFLLPQHRIERVDLTLEITRTKKVHGQPVIELWEAQKCVIKEEGYPTTNSIWRSQFKNGEAIAARLKEEEQA